MPRQHLTRQPFKERRRKIPFAQARNNHANSLSLVLRSGSDLCCRANIRTTRNAAYNAFFLGQAPRPLESFLVRDLNRFVHQRRIEIPRYEARANSLNLMWSRLAT